MDFINLTTEQGAAFIFNIRNITLIDPDSNQLYTVDNPAYGWTLSQQSMADLMAVVGPHIVAADQPIPAPPIAPPPNWDYPLNTAGPNPEPVAKVWKEWNPNDNQDPPPTVTVVPLEPASWSKAVEALEHILELTEKKAALLEDTLEAARRLEAAEAREGIHL